MLRKSLLTLLATLLVAGTFFLIYLIIGEASRKKLSRQNLATIATFTLFDLDSTRYYLDENHKTVLVYFDSECSNCRHELNEIISNRIFFKDADIILISSEQIRSIKLYAKQICPSKTDIRFAKINPDEAFKVFESLVVPQIFIYGADGRLIRTFKGETKMDAILQYL